MNRGCSLGFSAVVLLVPAFSHAADALHHPEVTAPRISSPPRIDGVIGDDEWRAAAHLGGFISMSKALVEPPSEGFISYDEERLYVAFRIRRDFRVPLKIKAPERDKEVWRDDAVELWLRPHEDHGNFALLGNTVGIVADFNDEKNRFLWHADWKYESAVYRDRWEAELSIPFSELGSEMPAPGDRWGFNLCYYKFDPDIDRPGWSYTEKFTGCDPFHGKLIFGRALACQLSGIGSLAPDQAGLTGGVVNASAAAARIKTSFALYRKTDQPGQLQWKYTHSNYEQLDRTEQELSAAPGAVTPLSYSRSVVPGEYLVSCRVVDAANGGTLLAQDVPFTVFPQIRMRVVPYFLTQGKVKVRVDLRGIWDELPEQSRVKVTIGPGVQQTAPATEQFDVWLDVSRLGAGTHVVTAEIMNNKERVLDRSVTSFEKPPTPVWHQSGAGETDEVLPPWPPLEVQAGTVVKVWGRDYVLANSGLPRQIVNYAETYYPRRVPKEGVQMLTGPVAFRMQADGVKLTWQDTAPRLVSRTAARAVFEGRGSAGPVKVTNQVTVEYDGMMRVDVSLEPRQTVLLNEFLLEIPLASEFVKLFTREQLVDLKGTGIPTATANRGSIPSAGLSIPFTPWLWVGDHERGLFWFAESARGWRVADSNKVLELLPRGRTSLLRVGFRDVPSELSQPLTITFGIEATPVKPFPSEKVFQVDYRTIQAPTFDRQFSKETVLSYPARGNLQLAEGTVGAFFIPGFDTSQKAILFRIERAGGPELTLTWDKGLSFGGRKRVTAEMNWRQSRSQHIAVAWRQQADTTDIAILVNGKLVGRGALPRSYFAGELAADDRIVIGGERTLVLDEFRISSVARQPRGRPAVIEHDEHTLLLDHLEAVRFYRGKVMTRAEVIQSDVAHPLGFKGGIAGSAYTGRQARPVPATIGNGLLLPVPDEYYYVDIAIDYGVKHAYLYEVYPWAMLEEGQKTNVYTPPFYQSARVKQHVKRFEDRGLNVEFYFGASFSTRNPEFKHFGDEMVWVPRYPSSYESFVVCNNSPSQDMKVDGIKRSIETYGMDGLLMDHVIHTWPCQHAEHGCGYLDERGQLRPVFNIFAARETAKRIYALFHGSQKPLQTPGRVVNHTSVFAPVFAFSDIWKSGEAQQGAHERGLKNLFPLDHYATFYGSQQYGVPREHLSKDSKFPFGPNWIYTLSLLHNQMLRTMRSQFNPRRFVLDHGYDPYYAEPGVSSVADPTLLLWHVRDEFGIGEPDVEFYPYWKNEEYVQLTPAHLKTSFHLKHGERVQLVVSNFLREEIDANIQLNLPSMGLDGKQLAAYDALLSQPLEMNGSVVRATILPERYRLINVEVVEP